MQTTTNFIGLAIDLRLRLTQRRSGVQSGMTAAVATSRRARSNSLRTAMALISLTMERWRRLPPTVVHQSKQPPGPASLAKTPFERRHEQNPSLHFPQ
jgi:hypothetical protein